MKKPTKAELEAELSELKQKASTHWAMIDEYRKRYAKQETELEALKKDNQKLIDENQNQSTEIQELKDEIYKLKDNISKDNSQKLINEIDLLKELNASLTKENQKLISENSELQSQNSQELINEYTKQLQAFDNKPQHIHNERNAGRKSIITDKLISSVVAMSKNGMSQKLISKQLNISVGTVNKILKVNKPD